MKSLNDIYASRIGEKERIVPRNDPVVYNELALDSPHLLKSKQLQSYEQDGFLILPDYLPELVKPLLDEIPVLANKLKGKEELCAEPDSDAVRTIFKPFAYSQLIDQFCRHPKILHIVRQMLGSQVYVSQSRINMKPAYTGRSFPWHSDFETWHVEDGMPRMRAVTAWIMLTENSEYNGPLYVIPGSHKYFVSCAGKTGNKNYESSLKKQVLGVPQHETMNKLLSGRAIKGVYGKPGTVVFHECNLMHGSPDNISADPRMLLMVVYNSCENAFLEPFSDQSPRPHYLRNTDAEPLEIMD